MKKITLILVAVFFAGAFVPAEAGAFGSSRGGSFSSSRSSSSSSSKSYGGSKSSSSSKSYSSSKPAVATASKPSTGSKSQPAPVTKIIPPSPPRLPSRIGSTGRAPSQVFGGAGRNYSRDRSFITQHPRYADPYYSRAVGGYGYFGLYDSPFYYMWLGSYFGGNRSDRPLPPEANGNQISEAIVSYLGLIDAERKMVAP